MQKHEQFIIGKLESSRLSYHRQFSGNCYVPCDSRSVRVINNNMLNVLYYVNYNIYVKRCPVLADIIHEMYA